MEHAGQRGAVLGWDEVLALGDARPDDIAERVAALAPDDIACIIYTSGTGGVPKGVMLSHRNILANCRGAYHLLEMLGLGDEVFLSFLPLSHSYEHTAGLMFPISIGAQIYFAEGADTLAANLLEVQPTIMTAVPRLYETMHQRIRRGIEREKGLKRSLFEKAVDGRPQAACRRRPRLRRAPGRSAARKAGARQGAGPVRRAAEGDGLGRRAAQPGDRQLLSRAGGAAAARLRPDRGGAGGVLQPARRDQDRLGRAAAPRGRGQNRRGRRDPGRRRQRDERLLERPRGDRPHRRQRLAAHRRYRLSRRRRLSAHHRPQARLHQEFRRRHDRAGARSRAA